MCRNSNLTSKTCFGSLNFIRVVLRYFSSDLSNCMKGRVICKQARKKTIWRGWPHSEIEASKSQRHGLVFFVASIIYSNKSISIRLYMKSWVFTVYYTVHFIIYILKFIIFPFKANSEVGCFFFTFSRFHGRKTYELSYFRHRNMSTLKYIVLVKSKVFKI